MPDEKSQKSQIWNHFPEEDPKSTPSADHEKWRGNYQLPVQKRCWSYPKPAKKESKNWYPSVQGVSAQKIRIYVSYYGNKRKTSAEIRTRRCQTGIGSSCIFADSNYVCEICPNFTYWTQFSFCLCSLLMNTKSAVSKIGYFVWRIYLRNDKNQKTEQNCDFQYIAEKKTERSLRSPPPASSPDVEWPAPISSFSHFMPRIWSWMKRHISIEKTLFRIDLSVLCHIGKFWCGRPE